MNIPLRNLFTKLNTELNVINKLKVGKSKVLIYNFYKRYLSTGMFSSESHVKGGQHWNHTAEAHLKGQKHSLEV
jgi:hypothetical protein